MPTTNQKIADLCSKGFILPDVVCWAPGHTSPQGNQVPGHWEMQEARKPATRDHKRKWFCIVDKRAHDLIAAEFARQTSMNAFGGPAFWRKAKRAMEWGQHHGNSEAAIDALWKAVCDV